MLAAKVCVPVLRDVGSGYEILTNVQYYMIMYCNLIIKSTDVTSIDLICDMITIRQIILCLEIGN
mgnify:CR=1 FL=1